MLLDLTNLIYKIMVDGLKKKCFIVVYANKHVQINVRSLTNWKTVVSDLIHLQNLHRINWDSETNS